MATLTRRIPLLQHKWNWDISRSICGRLFRASGFLFTFGLGAFFAVTAWGEWNSDVAGNPVAVGNLNGASYHSRVRNNDQAGRVECIVSDRVFLYFCFIWALNFLFGLCYFANRLLRK